MKILLRFLIGTAFFVGMVLLLRAQDFVPERAKGTVLLLKNGHAMEGEIERLGAQMRVRSGTGEVWVAAEKSARLCADWDDAFLFVQTLIKPNDAGDRVKLARWCQLYRLTDKALEQARKALALQPDHGDAKQLVMMLERAKNLPPEPKRTAPASSPRKTFEPTPTVDVTSDTLIKFTTYVQPILMNTCASCHANGYVGKFTLERVAEAGSKAATQRNLAAVLEQIDLDHPRISPLLVRAITRHGGEQAAPIPGRDAKALQTIHHWIEQTIATNPQLKDYRAVNKKAMTVAKPEMQPELTIRNPPLKPQSRELKPVSAPPIQEGPDPAPPLTEQPTLEIASQAKEPAAAPRPLPATVTQTQAQLPDAVADPFDPETFNRHFHAKRMKPAANP